MKIKSKDARSVLKLLPAAILALALSLSEQDLEVLAYLITRSIVITTTNPSSSSTSTTIEQHHKKEKCKKVQKDPIFQCGCFECYTRFWVRWDSSPNRELIHQAIEAFEDHLTRNESSKNNGRARKRDRLVGRRRRCEVGMSSSVDVIVSPVKEFETTTEIAAASGFLVAEVEEEECSGGGDGKENGCDEGEEVKKLLIGGGGGGGGDDDGVAGKLEMEAVTVQSPVSNHKGLAWKVLPDVVGIFNSRLWSLWSPNI